MAKRRSGSPELLTDPEFLFGPVRQVGKTAYDTRLDVLDDDIGEVEFWRPDVLYADISRLPVRPGAIRIGEDRSLSLPLSLTLEIALGRDSVDDFGDFNDEWTDYAYAKGLDVDYWDDSRGEEWSEMRRRELPRQATLSVSATTVVGCELVASSDAWKLPTNRHLKQIALDYLLDEGAALLLGRAGQRAWSELRKRFHYPASRRHEFEDTLEHAEWHGRGRV